MFYIGPCITSCSLRCVCCDCPFLLLLKRRIWQLLVWFLTKWYSFCVCFCMFHYFIFIYVYLILQHHFFLMIQGILKSFYFCIAILSKSNWYIFFTLYLDFCIRGFCILFITSFVCSLKLIGDKLNPLLLYLIIYLNLLLPLFT